MPFRTGVSALGLMLIASCGGGAGTPGGTTAPSRPVLSRLEVRVSPNTLQVDETATANATGYDQNNQPIATGPLTWSVEPAALASIDGNGVVAGLASGQVTVTASASGVRGIMSLTVLPVPVARVSVAPSSATLDIGLSRQLTVSVVDRGSHNVTDRGVLWTSSDSVRVPVSPEGLVTALAPGAVTITATCDGVSDSVVVHVTTRVVPVATVTLAPSTATIALGQQIQLTVAPWDAAGNALAGRTPTWSSSAPDIVSVSATGMARAASSGTALVTATIDGQRASASVSVNDDVVVSVVRPDTVEIVVDTLTISADVIAKRKLVSVVAKVEPTSPGFYEVPLVHTDHYNKWGVLVGASWDAPLSVKYLGTGQFQLIITATDVNNVQGVAVRTFLHQPLGGAGNVSAGGKK